MASRHDLTLSDAIRKTIQDEAKISGAEALAQRAGVHVATLQRALAGRKISQKTFRALEKIKPRVRTADEFRDVLASAVRPPRLRETPTTWELETIRDARDEQLRGRFAAPVALARAMRTDDAIFTARTNRVAPHDAIASRLVPADGRRGERCAARAAESVFVPRTVVGGLLGTLVDHGVAVGYVEHEPNEDGTRIDFRLREWPLEFVDYDPQTERLRTRTRDASQAEIVHGDGRWIVFRKHDLLPWTIDATLLAAAFVWASHGGVLQDWNYSTRSHGLSKILGELPDGFAIAKGDGTLSNEASAYRDMLRDLMTGDAPAGVQPPGAKTTVLANTSGAWQVFSELALNREKAAARIYLGTDAHLGSVGGAPGVDIATLFGVSTTRLQGDLDALSSALNVGVYQPWAAVNDGDSRLAPRHEYVVPDPDEDAKHEQAAAKEQRLAEAIVRRREAGLVVNQQVVDDLALRFGVSPAPRLAPVVSDPSAAD